MKSTDQYFDSKVYPSGVVAQNIVNGNFFSTDGRFNVGRPERAQLLPPSALAILFQVSNNCENVQEVKIATLLDYLTATANAMGKPGAWMNAHNGVDARVAQFVLLASPSTKVRATVAVVNEFAFMPAFEVWVYIDKGKFPRQDLYRATEPTLAHVVTQLLIWRERIREAALKSTTPA